MKICSEHKGHPSIDGETPGCCGCGSLYHTAVCEQCGQEFLDWNARGFDDVCAGPYATSAGDLYCTRCGSEEGRRQEQMDHDPEDGYGPDTADIYE